MVPRVMLKYKAAGNVSPWVEGSERNADALSRLVAEGSQPSKKPGGRELMGGRSLGWGCSGGWVGEVGGQRC